MVQSVIFDLDGLLIDSEMVLYRIYRDMLATIGHEFTLTDYLPGFFGRPIRPIMANLILRFGLPATLEEACAHVESEEAEARCGGIPLKPGARQLLEDLRESGLSIALGTSSIRECASSILEAHGILDRSDALIRVEDITRGKPDPQVFLSAAATLGAVPVYCLVLEDSEMGIEAAHATNISVVRVPDLKQPDEAHRAMTTRALDSLTEASLQLLMTPPRPRCGQLWDRCRNCVADLHQILVVDQQHWARTLIGLLFQREDFMGRGHVLKEESVVIDAAEEDALGVQQVFAHHCAMNNLRDLGEQTEGVLQVLLAARHIGLFSPRGSLADADDGVDANPRSSTPPGY